MCKCVYVFWISIIALCSREWHAPSIVQGPATGPLRRGVNRAWMRQLVKEITPTPPQRMKKEKKGKTFRSSKKLVLFSLSLFFSLSFFRFSLPSSFQKSFQPSFAAWRTRVLSLYPSSVLFPQKPSFPSPFPFLLTRPTEINDSEILIQWQGCRCELGSRLSFLHALRLPVFPTRATHPVFLLHKQPAKLKGSFFSGWSRYKSRMKKVRTFRRWLKWWQLLSRDNDDKKKRINT